MHGLWGMGQMMFTKYLVLLDDEFCARPPDVHNTSEVLFRLCANTDPQRDSIVAVRKDSPKVRPTCSTTPSEVASGSKLDIDATKKIPREGFKRPWPPLINMDAEVRRQMDALFKVNPQQPT